MQWSTPCVRNMSDSWTRMSLSGPRRLDPRQEATTFTGGPTRCHGTDEPDVLRTVHPGKHQNPQPHQCRHCLPDTQGRRVSDDHETAVTLSLDQSMMVQDAGFTDGTSYHSDMDAMGSVIRNKRLLEFVLVRPMSILQINCLTPSRANLELCFVFPDHKYAL